MPIVIDQMDVQPAQGSTSGTPREGGEGQEARAGSPPKPLDENELKRVIAIISARSGRLRAH